MQVTSHNEAEKQVCLSERFHQPRKEQQCGNQSKMLSQGSKWRALVETQIYLCRERTGTRQRAAEYSQKYSSSWRRVQPNVN